MHADVQRLNDLASAQDQQVPERFFSGLATVLDTTDSAVIRFVVDDPERARELLREHDFPFNESELLVVELDSATNLNNLMAALLEAELNINYLYCFIPHPQGKSLIALSMEDNEIGEQVLTRHQFRVLRQMDISR